jgi:hypothetical protein
VWHGRRVVEEGSGAVSDSGAQFDALGRAEGVGEEEGEVVTVLNGTALAAVLEGDPGLVEVGL